MSNAAALLEAKRSARAAHAAGTTKNPYPRGTLQSLTFLLELQRLTFREKV